MQFMQLYDGYKGIFNLLIVRTDCSLKYKFKRFLFTQVYIVFNSNQQMQ